MKAAQLSLIEADLSESPGDFSRVGQWRESRARFSDCGLYRYELLRVWEPEGERILWVMLNPSTADGRRNDPTITRCETFSRDWGYGSLEVCNLFAWRSTDPKGLKGIADPIGPLNDAALLYAVDRAARVMVAWGNDGKLLARNLIVSDFLKPHRDKVFCLGRNKDGNPKHPLYLAGSVEPEPYFENKETPAWVNRLKTLRDQTMNGIPL